MSSERKDGGALREGLAEYAHDAWAGWMKYMFEKGAVVKARNNDTGLFEDIYIMPAWAVERWQRQMTTAYADLPDAEKESDRLEADRMIEVWDRTPPEQVAETLNWDKAKAHLDFMAKTYEELAGGVGRFALAITIMPLQDRYEKGERTEWLYNEIMEVE